MGTQPGQEEKSCFDDLGCYMTIDTVDGKNKAPPDMYESQKNHIFATGECRISEPSTV